MKTSVSNTKKGVPENQNKKQNGADVPAAIPMPEEIRKAVSGSGLGDDEYMFFPKMRSGKPSLLETFEEKLHKIAEREDDWDGKGSKKPNPLVLSQAHNTLEYFLYSVVNSGRLWVPPFVSSDEDGHITIQWKHGDRELYMEIGQEEIAYTKVWGVNIEHEMHLGILKKKDFLNLWDWLNASYLGPLGGPWHAWCH